MNQMKFLYKRIENYFDRLWPIPRSITGPGYEKSLDILSEVAPFERIEFYTGDKVLDWTIPNEWLPRKAFIIDPDGKKRADFSENNLHLVGYSVPFQGVLPLSELKKNINTLPDQPTAIPYITSYYSEAWGFCLSHDEYKSLPDGDYEVVIDTDLKKGKLTIGEVVLEGSLDKEILISSYLCHPSMANNELSGPLVLSFLYEAIANLNSRKYTYRFVIAPETIGSIAYLSLRGNDLKNNLIAGYQITCIGDHGQFTYKKSREGDTLADRAAMQIMREMKNENVIPFNPAFGSDERQYCSPGFNLPVGSLMRTMYTKYPEYHTSLDNKDLMDFKGMEEAVETLTSIIHNIEINSIWENKYPYGEPQLGKRNLFRSLSDKTRDDDEMAMWWLLNYSDGSNDLLSIANLSGHTMKTLARVATKLNEAGILFNG